MYHIANREFENVAQLKYVRATVKGKDVPDHI
jgi:hypothetical protein